jgi:hypothetical protein
MYNKHLIWGLLIFDFPALHVSPHSTVKGNLYFDYRVSIQWLLKRVENMCDIFNIESVYFCNSKYHPDKDDRQTIENHNSLW